MSSGSAGGAELSAYFDHTLLKPECNFSDIVRLCKEAKQYEFATVCVNPYWVPDAAVQLAGSARRYYDGCRVSAWGVKHGC